MFTEAKNENTGFRCFKLNCATVLVFFVFRLYKLNFQVTACNLVFMAFTVIKR
jgi:hypothetical protein